MGREDAVAAIEQELELKEQERRGRELGGRRDDGGPAGTTGPP